MYQRPKKTITDEYQNEESIKEKLKDYVEINPEEIDNLPVDTHLRYITYNTQQKRELFRFGGFLKIIHPKYIILKTKKNSFSVQRYIYDYKGNLIYKTRFFKNKNNSNNNKNEVLEDVLQRTVEKSKEILSKQNNIISQQQDEIQELRKLVKNLSKNK